MRAAPPPRVYPPRTSRAAGPAISATTASAIRVLPRPEDSAPDAAGPGVVAVGVFGLLKIPLKTMSLYDWIWVLPFTVFLRGMIGTLSY